MHDLRERCKELFIRIVYETTEEPIELPIAVQSDVELIYAFAREVIEACARVAEEGMITMRPEDFDREYIVAINGARKAIAAAIRQVEKRP